MREQACVLEHVADGAPVGRNEGSPCRPARPRRRRRPGRRQAVSPAMRAQQRGLAAAGRAEQRGDAAPAPRTRRRARTRRAGRAAATSSRRRSVGAHRLRTGRCRLLEQHHARSRRRRTPACRRPGYGPWPRQRLDIVVDGDRQHLGLAGNVAADHQHHAEFADGMGEAQHRAGEEAGTRQRQRRRTRSVSQGEARSVAAASSGRSPMPRRRCASAAPRTACE